MSTKKIIIIAAAIEMAIILTAIIYKVFSK